MGNWRTSSYSGANGGQCVEVASRSKGVEVRDSADRDGATLTFGPRAWQAFAANLKDRQTGPLG